MEDYKSNSHVSKEIQNDESISEKKTQAVVSGSAKTKKRSGTHKLADIFIAEDVSNVKSYVFMDVIIPSIKKAIADVVTNGIDMLLYGGSGKSERSKASKISYRSYYERGRDDHRETIRARNSFDYDDIIFDNRGDAESVLQAMDDILEQYGVVSVGDLYDLADISTSDYTVNKYGWSNIRNAQVVRTRDGYLIKLPRALPID